MSASDFQAEAMTCPWSGQTLIVALIVSAIIPADYPRRFVGGPQGLERAFSRPFAFSGGKGVRTAIYVDGFNFYYGAVKGTPFKWLDLKRLCELILKPEQRIVSLVYCTARVKPKPEDPGAPARQGTYLKALKAHVPETKIIYGHFLETKLLCKPVDPALGRLVEVMRSEEKGSDVNLSVHLVNDAWKNEYDCAIVISNDSDLAEAMRIVKGECGKIVGLFTPWRRHTSKQLMPYSTFQRTIRRSALAKCQLPNPVPGTKIYKPGTW